MLLLCDGHKARDDKAVDGFKGRHETVRFVLHNKLLSELRRRAKLGV